MSQVHYSGPGELHVTRIQEARTMDKSCFDRVITVCQDEISDNVSDSTEYSHYCMSDGRATVEDQYGGSCEYGLFAEAADELYGALRDSETVLIHCHAGQSRSVSVASASIARLTDMQPDTALELVQDAREVFQDPDGLLLDHLERYAQESERRS